MNIPIEANQKFQIGDICKIIHTKKCEYSPIEDHEDPYVGLYVIILGSYWQICGSPYFSITNEDGIKSPLKNLSNYQVIAPYHLNKERCVKQYDDFYKCDTYKYDWGMWCTKEFAWSWVDEFQLEFVRRWNDDEREKYIKDVELEQITQRSQKRTIIIY